MEKTATERYSTRMQVKRAKEAGPITKTYDEVYEEILSFPSEYQWKQERPKSVSNNYLRNISRSGTPNNEYGAYDTNRT